MTIIEVVFLENVQSVQTGNEYYQRGTRAHFPESQATALIEEGYAAQYPHDPMPLPPEPSELVEITVTLDFSTLTVKELRLLAKDAGVYKANMKKADLVAALEAANG